MVLFFVPIKLKSCVILSCGSPLMSMIKHCRKICQQVVFAILAKKKNIKGSCGQKCTEEIAYIARITNSTWIEGGSNFSKNMLYRNCLLKKSAKIAEVTTNFIATKKTP